MMRVADYIMDRIYEHNIKHIFMVTGRGVLYLSDAVARQADLMGISVHHEQAAAFAAMAYAECNEGMGACLVSTGCAGTNAVTGVLCAWQDEVPCIFISGQNKLDETTRYSKLPLRTFGNQEADIIQIVDSITKYAVMLTKAEDIAYELDKAFYLAENGRKGPVWIDVPLDIQNMRVEPEELKRFIPEEAGTEVVSSDLAFVVNELNLSKRPIVMIGSGIRNADAIEELKEFLNKNKIPVVWDCSGVDICEDSNNTLGEVASLGGNRAANFTVQNADLLLVIGSRLSPVTTGDTYTKFARDAKKIVIDVDDIENAKGTVKVDRLIVADLKKFLLALSRQKLQLEIDEWNEKCTHWKEIFPRCENKYKKSELVDMYYLAECFSEKMSKDSVFISDAGMEELIFPSTIKFHGNQRCVHPASQGAMGVAIPAAIGAEFAKRGPVVVAVGDGSIMMNLQELQTISYYKLPVKIFVINNECYSVIRKRQKELFRNRTIGTDKENGVACPEFKKVAECFDLQYEIISNTYDAMQQVENVLKMDGPVICEVMGVVDQEYIRSAYAKTSERRFVERPLEDQAPFMDRKVFLDEMVIEPIDQ